jgi:hypothetical protein
MKKFIAILAGIAVLAFVAINSFGPEGFDPGRLLNPGLYAKFGNFGGLGRKPGEPEPFDAKAIKFGIRWYPTYVSFGPDNDTLLVSLCHVQRNGLCRIGKYSLSKDQWDVYAYDERRAYDKALFSPDGQWIYYSASDLCDENYNECGDPKVYRMRPDGTGTEMVADVTMASPSFSVDGTKIIYWGQQVSGGGRRSGGLTLFYLDLKTREQVPLTDHVYDVNWQNRPFLTADGEHFIFAANLSKWQDQTSCVVDPKTIPADPKTGKKDFGPLFGEKENTGLYMAALKDAPISKDNCYKLTPIWGKDSGHPSPAPCAMDGQGRFLYAFDLTRKKQSGSAVALALRPAPQNYRKNVPLTFAEQQQEDRRNSAAMLTDKQLSQGEGVGLFHRKWIDDDLYQQGAGSALFLRKLSSGGADESAFDTPRSCAIAGVAPDGNSVAYVQPDNVGSPTVYSAIAVIAQGQSFKDVRYILNWPKLDLQPTLPASR